jgi:hypothetical protein
VHKCLYLTSSMSFVECCDAGTFIWKREVFTSKLMHSTTCHLSATFPRVRGPLFGHDKVPTWVHTSWKIIRRPKEEAGGRTGPEGRRPA